MKKFLYELSKKIILIITRERNVPIILFISLLLFIFLFFSYDYFYPITRDTSIFIKPIPESNSKPEEIEKEDEKGKNSEPADVPIPEKCPLKDTDVKELLLVLLTVMTEMSYQLFGGGHEKAKE